MFPHPFLHFLGCRVSRLRFPSPRRPIFRSTLFLRHDYCPPVSNHLSVISLPVTIHWSLIHGRLYRRLLILSTHKPPQQSAISSRRSARGEPQRDWETRGRGETLSFAASLILPISVSRFPPCLCVSVVIFELKADC